MDVSSKKTRVWDIFLLQSGCCGLGRRRAEPPSCEVASGVSTFLSFTVEKRRARGTCSAFGGGGCAHKPWVEVEVVDFLHGRAALEGKAAGWLGSRYLRRWRSLAA